MQKLVVVAALAVSIGSPWALLQSLAWAGMLVNFARDASLAEAVSMTFDGNHLCQVCKEIRAAKAKERKESKSGLQTISEDLKLNFPPQGVFIPPPPDPALATQLSTIPAARAERPPVPPPRST